MSSVEKRIDQSMSIRPVPPPHKRVKVDEMSRFSKIERVREIARQLPAKRPGQTEYANRQYRNLEEMVKICQNLHKQTEQLRQQIRDLQKRT